MANVGFIGLGTMGRPMARNLIAAGHRLHVLARRREVADEFAGLGAAVTDAPAEVAALSEFICTIVTDDDAVREVVLGQRGLIHGAAAGKTLVEMSTIAPATIRELGRHLARCGMAVLDAPVSGGPWGAAAATLTIMVGGDASAFDSARPVLAALGSKLVHLGPLGSGQQAKLINQLMGGGIMALVAEGLVLAEALGMDRQRLLECLTASSGNSALLEARGQKYVLANRYPPGFTTGLMRKDMRLALELARAAGGLSTPVAAAALAQYSAAIDQGYGGDDFASIARVYRRAAGLHEPSPAAAQTSAEERT